MFPLKNFARKGLDNSEFSQYFQGSTCEHLRGPEIKLKSYLLIGPVKIPYC